VIIDSSTLDSPSRTHLHPVAEEDEGEQDHRSLVEDLAREEERGGNAEEVARADRERDQDAHVEGPMA
jgi:hypothetical protein